MSANITLNDKKFRDAMNRYLALSGKTFSETINRKIYFILLKGRKRIRPAKRSDIERVYGPLIRVSKKTGRLSKKNRESKANPIAIMMAEPDLRDKIRGAKTRAEVLAAAKAFVARKYRAPHYTIAGFNDPLRKFQRAAGPTAKGHKISRGPRRKEQRGSGFPARTKGNVAQRVSALAIYSLRSTWGAGRAQVPARVDRAVKIETIKERQDFFDHVTKKEMDQLQRKAGLL